MIRLIGLVASVAFLLVTAPASAQTGSAHETSTPEHRPTDASAWRIDKSHSELTFQIRHFMGRVRGTFRDWSGTIVVADPVKWEEASVDVAIKTASTFTDHDKRDEDLRSSSFFAADSFPTITFKSTRIERAGDAAKIHGNVTMRAVTRPVVLEGKFLGLAQFPNDVERVGFEATTTINRLDFGVSWNRLVEGAGMTLGDEVKIDVTIEATRKRSS